jgi:CRP-like cAMP-binding protein
VARLKAELSPLRAIPLFAASPPHILESWLRGSVMRTLRGGHMILAEGEDATHVFTLLSGVVRVFFRGQERRKIVAKLFSGPAFFGEMEVLTGIPHLESVDVLQTARVLATPKAIFLEALRRDHALTARLLLDLSARFCVTAHLAKCAAFQTVEHRLASLLLSYGEVWGVLDGKVLRISRPMTLDELADGLGVNRRSIERTLSEFERRGWVSRHKKHLSLTDVRSLEQCSGELRLGVDYSLLKAESRPNSSWEFLAQL